MLVPFSVHVRVLPDGVDEGRILGRAFCGDAAVLRDDRRAKKSEAMPTARSGVMGADASASGRMAASNGRNVFTLRMILYLPATFKR